MFGTAVFITEIVGYRRHTPVVEGTTHTCLVVGREPNLHGTKGWNRIALHLFSSLPTCGENLIY